LKEDQANFHFRWNWDEEKKLRGIRLQESFPNLSPHLFRGGGKDFDDTIIATNALERDKRKLI
jgi:hypothetical protein